MRDPNRCPICGAPRALATATIVRKRGTRLNGGSIPETCGEEYCVARARRIRLKARALPLELALAPRWVPSVSGRWANYDGTTLRRTKDGLRQHQMTDLPDMMLSKPWKNPRACAVSRANYAPSTAVAAGFVPGGSYGLVRVAQGVQADGLISSRGRAVRDALGPTYCETQGRDLLLVIRCPETFGDRTGGRVEVLCRAPHPQLLNLCGMAGSARVLAEPGAAAIEEVLREYA